MMMGTLLFLASILLAASATDSKTSVPVLLELFTSEGCSSCPPADQLLAKLEKQPIPGVEVIVLSEHVDYWNSLGWRDPYSSAQWSDRQRAYARHLDGQVYTPELVINGAKGMIGSDERAITSAIRAAAGTPTPRLTLTVERNGSTATVTITNAPAGHLYLAVVRDEAVSTVTSGENGGQTLRHVAVVDRMVSTTARTAKLKLEPGSRVVAFVTAEPNGKVIALGTD